ncbi:MAG: 6,7-dimethyl-8-ribityllumazine synthase [Thermoplasmata archaeon]|jgi:6,7-dimethyl-8-ribityllumazine synthase|nr:6,7-dimethyl-8-ribityllumazine synthase [Thermoplasmata archaeon]
MAEPNEPKVDATEEFEEYTAPPRTDEQGNPVPRAKGLRAAGYQFPPPDPNVPLTKANLAKGLGVPEIPRAQPAAARDWPVPALPGQQPAQPAEGAPAVKVTEDALFEEYRRPDLDVHPRTGRGLRADPPPQPKAQDILAKWKEPDIQVATPRRFGVLPPRPDRPATQEAQVEDDQALLDAASDVAAASRGAVMSNPTANGPLQTVVHHEDDDLFAPIPEVPPALPGPPKAAAARQPHTSDAPRPAPDPGKACRIGLVQAEFNLGITSAMAAAAKEEAERLGAVVVAHAKVPGAFDTPLAVQRLLQRADVDAVVVIGCIIQGETGHDVVIADATARALVDLALRFDRPVGLAITGPRMTQAQGEARIGAAAFAVASVVVQHRLTV